MRHKDEHKAKVILETAARLFAERPFSKVLLDDVAEAAGVGKGTIYIYFKSKEELYFSLAASDMGEMAERYRMRIADHPADYRGNLSAAADAIAGFAMRHHQLFEIMRTVVIPDTSTRLDINRRAFGKLVEEVIRHGNAAGELADCHPQRTPFYLMSMVRALMWYHPEIVDARDLASHVASVLLDGITRDPHEAASA